MIFKICETNHEVKKTGGIRTRKKTSNDFIAEKGLSKKMTCLRSRKAAKPQGRKAEIKFGFVYDRLGAKPHGRN